jgi:hypothetical protein
MLKKLVAIIIPFMIIFFICLQANAMEKTPILQVKSLDNFEAIALTYQGIKIGNGSLSDCVANGGNCNERKNCKQDSDCGFITQGCSCQKGVCRDVTSSKS